MFSGPLVKVGVCGIQGTPPPTPLVDIDLLIVNHMITM